MTPGEHQEQRDRVRQSLVGEPDVYVRLHDVYSRRAAARGEAVPGGALAAAVATTLAHPPTEATS